MISEMRGTDTIVLGVPMHNFTVPGALRTWIDHVSRSDKTLRRQARIVISSRGAGYGDGDPDYPIPVDFQTPYLRHIFGFMGLKDVRFIAANGMDMGPESRAGGPVSPCRSLQLLRSTRP